ncbi:MAG: HEAT repeat domain-containing protein [Planctomycetota bacterium]|nr:HEAT repeat domain-containing protein [Planctomycetota bacterium]
MRICSPVLLAIVLAVVTTGAGASGVYHDLGPIQDEKLRQKLAAAAAGLEKQPEDLASLETLVAFFGCEPLEHLGTSVVYVYDDETKKRAYAALVDAHSIAFLCEALTKGSDLAAEWALRLIAHQSRNDACRDTPYGKRLRDGDGVVNGNAIARLREPVLGALKSRPPRVRALALRGHLSFLPAEESRTFVRGYVEDKDELVAAAAISGCGYRDAFLWPVLWRHLRTSKNEELLKACCSRLWLDDREDPGVTSEQQAILEQVALHPDKTVRESLTLALSNYAVPACPKMIALLMKLAEDKEEYVRYSAIRSLRNAKTPEVNKKLLEFFDESQPEQVRSAALEILGTFGEANVTTVIAASRDKRPNIRSDAAYWLRQIATPEALTALEAMLHDPDKNVRSRAATEWDWAQKEKEWRRKRKEEQAR